MIINAIDTRGRKVRIETVSEIRVDGDVSKVVGRKWVKSSNKFSGNVYTFLVQSWEAEPSNERTAAAFNASGVFAPFICVGKD